MLVSNMGYGAELTTLAIDAQITKDPFSLAIKAKTRPSEEAVKAVEFFFFQKAENQATPRKIVTRVWLWSDYLPPTREALSLILREDTPETRRTELMRETVRFLNDIIHHCEFVMRYY